MGQDQRALEPGRVVAGRYRLVVEVGKGGMGSVWRATVEATEASSTRAPPSRASAIDEVALKIILPARLEGSEEKRELALGRFSREAAALSRLRSPHVVTLHDHGRDGELVYLAMELLRGESLAERLKRVKQLDTEETVRLFNHITRALDLAHQHGIVHRDIKPGNIFLARLPSASEDVAKILDFGLVKSVGTPLATIDVHTRSGSLLGTPYYMSPEQARSRPDVDHRSDLWSLAVIAFECLCGVKPFRGRVLAKVIAQIASGQAPIPSETTSVPPSFDAWFARAMQVEPERRFQSASAMMEELREVLVDAAISTRIARKKRLEADVSGSSLSREPVPVTAPNGNSREPLPLVGRDVEFERADRAVAGGARVVGLFGPAGVGKTRLARELSIRWREERGLPGVAAWLEDADGAPWTWLELANALDMDGVGEPAEVDVARALRALGKAHVVLDAVDGSAHLLARALPEWLAAAPEVTVVYTARHPLGIAGEVVVELGPLPPPIARMTGLADLLHHPAGSLFLSCAVSKNAEVLNLDVRMLELQRFILSLGGLPLSLHLGSSMLAERPLDALASSLGAGLATPSGTMLIDAESMLEVTIAWLFRELPFAERSALAQLSVFRDGFTLDGAEAVIDGEWRHIRRPYEIVLDLARRGFLLQEEPLVGETRYRMPRPVRRHAQALCAATDDRLDPEASGAASRHATYIASIGSRAAVEALRTRGGLVRRNRLALEAQNLRAALEWADANMNREL
ncbi:MAG: protein kinase, partial [Deltaproteobacteria bacterium]|nr:protein kinase [Deltaproteobacteria bacterium]